MLVLQKGDCLASSETLTFGFDVATFKRGGTPMGRDGLRLVRS